MSGRQNNKSKKQSKPSVKPPGQKAKKKKNNNNRPGLQNDLRNVNLGTGRLGLGSSSRSSTNKRGQIITEDEYIGEIPGSVVFATTQYACNIGQAGTFPWGNKIASLYEKYDFLSCEFYVKREVSEYATNGQTGKVMLSFDFDASDSAPTSKQQVLDTIPHVDAMPCDPMIRLAIDCAQARKGPAKYVRPGLQPVNTDIKTYDIGNLYVSTSGCANTTAIGELHVRYSCRVEVPVLEAAGGAPNTPLNYFAITSALAGEASAATTTAGALFASATNPLILANGIGATIASTGVVTLPAGVYLVEFSYIASDTTASLTGSGLGLYGSSTIGSYPQSTGTAAFQDGSITGFNYARNAVNPLVWNTAVQGLVLLTSVANTYASGTCVNNGYLKITTL
jgi:hypothetical protein